MSLTQRYIDADRFKKSSTVNKVVINIEIIPTA